MRSPTQISRDAFFFEAVTILAFFLLLAFALIFFVLYYYKKRSQYLAEKDLLQTQFQKNLLQTQLEIQEQTFNTISQEIHDNVGQVLSLAKVQLNIMEQNETSSNNLLTDVKENISKAMTDLRDIAKSLCSDRIEELELKDLIEAEFNRIKRSGVLQTHFSVKGTERPIDSQKKLILFRMIQEGFQNIMKHANATTIFLILNFDEERLKVLIYDNGKGFDTTQLNGNTRGLGLRNIDKRCKLIQGSSEIESCPGNGTTLKLIIPYE